VWLRCAHQQDLLHASRTSQHVPHARAREGRSHARSGCCWAGPLLCRMVCVHMCDAPARLSLPMCGRGTHCGVVPHHLHALLCTHTPELSHLLRCLVALLLLLLLLVLATLVHSAVLGLLCVSWRAVRKGCELSGRKTHGGGHVTLFCTWGFTRLAAKPGGFDSFTHQTHTHLCHTQSQCSLGIPPCRRLLLLIAYYSSAGS
jgi:hypothetical protein